MYVDIEPTLHWYYIPAVLAFVFASKIQKDTFQQLQLLRRNKFGIKIIFYFIFSGKF